jgi:hypothetical protein
MTDVLVVATMESSASMLAAAWGTPSLEGGFIC